MERIYYRVDRTSGAEREDALEKGDNSFSSMRAIISVWQLAADGCDVGRDIQ